MSKKYKVQYTKHTSLMLMLFVRKSKLLIKHSQKLISNMLILQDGRGSALVSPVSQFRRSTVVCTCTLPTKSEE